MNALFPSSVIVFIWHQRIVALPFVNELDRERHQTRRKTSNESIRSHHHSGTRYATTLHPTRHRHSYPCQVQDGLMRHPGRGCHRRCRSPQSRLPFLSFQETRRSRKHRRNIDMNSQQAKSFIQTWHPMVIFMKNFLNFYAQKRISQWRDLILW